MSVRDVLFPFRITRILFPAPTKSAFSFLSYRPLWKHWGHLFKAWRNSDWRIAETHYNEALKAHAFSLNQEAQTKYLACLEHHPGHEPAMVNLAVLYLQNGDEAQAESLLNRVIDKNPYNEKAHYNRAILLTLMERHDEAIESLQQAITIQPRSFWALVTLAEIMVNRSQIEAALDYYQQALQCDVSTAQVHARMAELNYLVQDYEGAAKHLSTMLEKTPEAEGFYNLAWLLSENDEEIQRCLDLLRQAQSRKRGFEEALFNEAVMLSKKGNFESSLDRMKYYARMYRHNDKASYVKLYRALTAANPDNHHVAIEIAKLHYSLGHAKTAIHELKAILKRKADMEEAHDCYTQFLAECGHYDQALTALDQWVHVQPRNLIPNLRMAKIYAIKMEYQRARPVLKRIISIDPNHGEAHYQLATLCAQSGNWSDALLHYQKAAALNQNDDRIRKRIKMVQAEIQEQLAAQRP